ncbi:MAG: class I SAM-dependent methyltransferase [Planctomycetes bacterium]|nr:class I SAM-dependent methyltransferase [Planctomycetota bacterium]
MTVQTAAEEAAADGRCAAAGSAAAERLARYVEYDRTSAPYVRWQCEQFAPFLGNRILEVGCGVGSVVEQLGQRESIHGIDVEPELVEYCEQRFAGRPECRFSVIDISHADAAMLKSLADGRFDTIVCINALEHIRDDVRALLGMEAVLAADGRIALLVPAHPWLYGRYDTLDGHFRRYSKASLRRLVAHTNLRIVRMRYFNAVGALGWWVHYRLLRRARHSRRQLSAMNRLLPVVRRMERLIPPPFGLSLTAVLEKP